MHQKIVALLLCCLCIVSCSPSRETVIASNTIANAVPPLHTDPANTVTVSSRPVAPVQTPVKARPVFTPDTAGMICTTQMPGSTLCVNPNANAYDRGELPRPKSGCGAGQGCGRAYGSDTDGRAGTGYGNGQEKAVIEERIYENGSIDPDLLPPPPKRNWPKPKATSSNTGERRCYSQPRDPSSNAAPTLICY